MDIDEIPLIAGHPALDFLNTLEERASPAAVNYLPSYRASAALVGAGRLAVGTDAARLSRAQADHPGKAKKVWAAAMDLRRALDAIFRALAKGKPPPEDALARAQRRRSRPRTPHRRLQPQAGGALALGLGAPGQAGDRALEHRAQRRRAADRSGARRAQVKVCGNPACDWLFLDDFAQRPAALVPHECLRQRRQGAPLPGAAARGA